MTSIRYRADIDGLRAIAVAAVIGFHAFPGAVPGGFVGVDVFFVISGFLISGIIWRNLERGTFSFLEFYRGRVRRIVPALIVVLASIWAAGWFLLPAADYEALGRHLLAAAFFASNIVLRHEAGYFDGSADLKPLLHLWSLAIEEQFYLVWPAILVVVWRRRLNAFVVLGAIALCSLALNIVATRTSPVWTFYALETRLWELAAGAILARLNTPVRPRAANVMALCGAALLLTSVIGADASAYPGWRALVPTSGAAALIAAGGDTWLSRRVLASTPLRAIGLISYPLYLWHWPLLSLARISDLREPSFINKAAIIASAVALAWATYRFIEYPIRFRGALPELPNRVAAALVALLCVIGGTGAVTTAASGFGTRFPDPERFLSDYKFDQSASYRAGRCLLEPVQKYFAPECIDSDAASKPIVFLWGDSHAAHLLPGLRRAQRRYGANFSIAQFTSSACPPLLGRDVDEAPFCSRDNDFALQELTRLRPAVVVIAAQWWTVQSNELPRLVATIDAIKKAGVEHVIAVGPVPVWSRSLPKLLMDAYATTMPHRLPRQMTAEIHSDEDPALRKIAHDHGADFVSAIDAFCTGSTCATMVGSPADIVAWDSAHLTEAGSIALVERIYYPAIALVLGKK